MLAPGVKITRLHNPVKITPRRAVRPPLLGESSPAAKSHGEKSSPISSTEPQLLASAA